MKGKSSSFRWGEASDVRKNGESSMNARVWLAGLLMAILPSIALAQGRIAVVNLEQAILQTDVAQQRLQEFETNEDFASDKSQFDALRAELDQLVKDFQRDQAAMSEEDQVAARQKMASKQSDLEYVAKKLQTLQTQNAQRGDAGTGAAGTRSAARDHRDRTGWPLASAASRYSR
jgi:Skp family chaperone for outer membrane proteins